MIFQTLIGINHINSYCSCNSTDAPLSVIVNWVKLPNFSLHNPRLRKKALRVFLYSHLNTILGWDVVDETATTQLGSHATGSGDTKLRDRVDRYIIHY